MQTEQMEVWEKKVVSFGGVETSSVAAGRGNSADVRGAGVD